MWTHAPDLVRSLSRTLETLQVRPTARVSIGRSRAGVLRMQRPERIRFFITEQCRRLDPTYRNFMYPKQILIGDLPLPLLEGSSLTFRVNQQKKISFRIRLSGKELHSGEPINIGIPLTQVESMSIKDHSRKHPEAALVFLLKNSVVDKLKELCRPYLDQIPSTGYKRHISRYLTVIVGTDPISKQAVYSRVVLLANKFTFPFGTAKKMLMKDIPLMWDDLVEERNEARVRTGVHHDREQMTEMDDEAWDWLMSFLRMKWGRCPYQGNWLVRDEAAHRRHALLNKPIKSEFLEEIDIKQEVCASKRMKYESAADSLPESSSPDSVSLF
ncbi:unnamed protein product [Caenorhabditis sp. 36 PRJEB53466]|nr:unnamed protein product [Caenorhabditis sp. 36 PRJEB53466]